MPRAPLERAVKDIIAAKEKARREQKADDARQQREQTRKKEQSSSRRRAARARTRSASRGSGGTPGRRPCRGARGIRGRHRPPVTESLEPWPEAVETAALLEELIKQLRRFIVFRHDTDAIAVALWIMFAWAHDVATHSPTLAVTSPDEPTAENPPCWACLHA